MPSSTHTSAHWAAWKPMIHKLYMENELPLPQVKKRMARMTPAFIATDSQYKKRFKKWGWRKYKKAPQPVVGSPEVMAELPVAATTGYNYGDWETQVIEPQLQHLPDSIDNHGGYSHPTDSPWAQSDLLSTLSTAQQSPDMFFEPLIDDLWSNSTGASYLSPADQKYLSAGEPNANTNSVPLPYPIASYPEYSTPRPENFATPMDRPINEFEARHT